MWSIPAFCLLGILGGALTTVAGMGGGLTMVVALSLFLSPVEAFAITAPALLAGNIHRMQMYRDQLPWAEAWPVALGAMPAALAGGLLATTVPDAALQGLIVLVASLALVQAIFRLTMRPSKRWSPVAGALAGFVSATTGGGGVILGPFLLSRGLTGPAYVAAAATAAASVHVFRVISYHLGGAGTARTLALGAGLAVLLTLGNLLGDRLRRTLGHAVQARVQVGVMVACVGLALVG
jgi:uncharacterized protein